MNESFFGFESDDEDDQYGEPYRRSPWRWATVLVALLALVVCGLMVLAGARTLSAAEENEQYVGRTWVIEGTYSTMSRDLNAQTYNGIYQGTLPMDTEIKDKTLDDGVNDPKKVQPGDRVQFRGTESGSTDDDFPKTVDALITEQNGTLKIVRTTESGQMTPVTREEISTAKLHGWLWVGGAALVLVLGAAGSLWSIRRVRRDEEGPEI